MEIKSWLKNSGVALVKNECCDSGSRTLKLFISRRNKLIFAWWWKFEKAKRGCDNYWINGCGLLSHVVLKSDVSQEWIDELSRIFTFWYKFRKFKNWTIHFHINSTMFFWTFKWNKVGFISIETNKPLSSSINKVNYSCFHKLEVLSHLKRD